jgi:hypothetical protein
MRQSFRIAVELARSDARNEVARQSGAQPHPANSGWNSKNTLGRTGSIRSLRSSGVTTVPSGKYSSGRRRMLDFFCAGRIPTDRCKPGGSPEFHRILHGMVWRKPSGRGIRPRTKKLCSAVGRGTETKKPREPCGPGLLFLIRATSYSPTHSRVQYHRGCRA